MSVKNNHKKINTEIRSVQGRQCALEYTLTRKSVKNINIRVKLDGRILVSASKSVPVDFIDNLIKQKEIFILEALKKYEQKTLEKQNTINDYIDGEQFKVLGEWLQLKVVQGINESVVIYNKEIILTVNDLNNRKRKEELWMTWLKELEKNIFINLCKKIYPLFQPYGIEFPIIKIRSMKTMWGSCRPSRGIITLNSKLIQQPIKCIEYVVLHEFAHFIHQNHSKEFYNFIEKRMPDWKERKNKLNQR